jgi:hypothetical protein
MRLRIWYLLLTSSLGLAFRLTAGLALTLLPDFIVRRAVFRTSGKLRGFIISVIWRLGFDDKLDKNLRVFPDDGASPLALDSVLGSAELPIIGSAKKRAGAIWQFEKDEASHCSSGSCETADQIVSVVMASNRDLSSVTNTLASIQRQCHRRIEVLLVRDGTRDDCATLELLRRQFDDINLTIVANNQARGAYASKNEGIKLARGDFLTFMDDDDESEPTRFHSQLLGLENSGSYANLCLSYSKYSGKNVIGDTGNALQPCLASLMIDLRNGAKPFFEDLDVGADTLLLSKIFVERGRVPVIASPLYRVNHEPLSLTRSRYPVRRWLPNRRDLLYFRYLFRLGSSSIAVDSNLCPE